jgi:hypothetical protein
MRLVSKSGAAEAMGQQALPDAAVEVILEMPMTVALLDFVMQ